MNNSLKPFSFKWTDNGLLVLDQTKLPTEIEYLLIDSVEAMFDAILTMKVRGAGSLSLVAAYGVYIGVKDKSYDTTEQLINDVCEVADYLTTCRPTAVSLSVVMAKMKSCARSHSHLQADDLKQVLLNESHYISEKSAESDTKIGEHALPFFNDGDTAITHCNTGIYASSGIGSATAPFYLGKERNINIKVYVDETRPLLQGSRLTAHELQQAGVDATLICDNMAGFLMQQGKIDKAIVGCDRIAANGDVVNKIGTYSLAVLAKHHGVPFYVTGLLEDVDYETTSGSLVPIEERLAEEITETFGKRTAPDGIKVYNPSFDVTPNDLITAIILDEGVVYPPFEENLLKLKNGVNNAK